MENLLNLEARPELPVSLTLICCVVLYKLFNFSKFNLFIGDRKKVLEKSSFSKSMKNLLEGL